MKTIAIAADHAGFELKEKLILILKEKGFLVKDYGTNGLASMDYPDVIHPLCKDLVKGDFERGIIICGSGNGVNITANKYQSVRSALCWTAEIASMARLHNDANIMALPARYIAFDEAVKCVDAFVNTTFEGGRHQGRVDKIVAC